ncbi:hypothetical protein ZIOFF_066641 [Zingiber officinale]|uniref:Hydrolase family protein / HAD-superfamily protein n=1 Tax=Zingiber officinale TaxID=94328 RepID=A0A8J5F3L3_ZINOF|nr:hypothetical protein ZIOFF_066641 [Zingiber officinale]
MGFRSVLLRASRARLRSSPSPEDPRFRRPSFGIAFDIDGVIIRGRTTIGGSSHALRRLYHADGIAIHILALLFYPASSRTLKVPFLFLTNGGGVPETKRSLELSELLGVPISPLQVVLGHSPFRQLVSRFENELIVAVGKGEPSLVMAEYGFKKVLSINDYASYFNDIDPLSQYKTWSLKQSFDKNCKLSFQSKFNVHSERVKGAFVVSDPIDWGRDIQVLCDILRYGGLPGKGNGHQPPLYFAADDLEYQAAFPCERLGMGAFRIALESIYNRIHSSPLEYTSYGKPNPSVFKNAESTLTKLALATYPAKETRVGKNFAFNIIYMIGDNPKVDVNGAKKAGHPWFPILTRTGVFKGKDNDEQFPADLVVDTVEEAVDFILKKENIQS